MKRKFAKIISFIMIMFILSSIFYKSFSFKYADGIYAFKEFYNERDNSIDVLFLGSSHMFVNVSPSILWKEYGMAGFDLGGSIQPLWNTYYYLKEALKTQSPEVIVIDCYSAVGCTDEYTDHSRIIKNNFGLKPSIDKIKSIKTSSPKDLWADYLLEYPTFHERYTDITEKDFQSGRSVDYIAYNCWKGQYLYYNMVEQMRPDVDAMGGTHALTDRNEKYLRKIIELAKRRDIPLVLMVAPYVLTNEDMRIYNRISEIADEYNIDYINFNYHYDNMSLDFSKDYADNAHMTYRGSEKFSKYLGKYLKNRYNIPDRRNNEDYISYDKMLRYYEQIIYNKELAGKNNLESYLAELQNENYIIVVSAIGNYKDLSNYKDVRKMLLGCDIDLNKASDNSVWIIKGGKKLSSSQGEDRYCWHEEVGKYDVLTVSSADAIVEIKLNTMAYQQAAEGINIWTYDMLTESFVGTVDFEEGEDLLQTM